MAMAMSFQLRRPEARSTGVCFPRLAIVAHISMACMVIAYIVLANYSYGLTIVVVYAVMARVNALRFRKIMCTYRHAAYLVMTYEFMAFIAVAYIVVAYIVMAESLFCHT